MLEERGHRIKKKMGEFLFGLCSFPAGLTMTDELPSSPLDLCSLAVCSCQLKVRMLGSYGIMELSKDDIFFFSIGRDSGIKIL